MTLRHSRLTQRHRHVAALLLAATSTACDSWRPTELVTGIAHSRMDASERTTCWIRNNSTLQCNGALLRGTSSPEDGAFVKVSVGGDVACGLRANGTVRCFLGWGDCSGPGCPPNTPPLVGTRGDIRRDLPGTFTDIDVDGSGLRILAIDSEHHVLRWDFDSTTGKFTDFETALASGGFGAAEHGGGDSTAQDRTRSDFVRIAGTPFQACGLGPAGNVTCWQLGNPGHSYAPPGTFVALSAGSGHLCALAVPEAESVVCWGENEGGQAADAHGRFATVSSGDNHTCSLLDTGEAECWGDGSSVPTEVPGGIFAAVAAGGGHRCGLRETGEVECWGFGAGLPALGSAEDVAGPIRGAVDHGCLRYDPSSVARFQCELGSGYLSTLGFTKVNATEFVQTFGATKQRNIWISGADAVLSDGGSLGVSAIYGAIDPDDPAEQLLAPIPVGTHIIHENPGGVQYELMTKLPAGAAPENGDWAFSKHSLDGARLPLSAASGYGGATPPTCLDCHEKAERRGRTDLLWGIPRSAMP